MRPRRPVRCSVLVTVVAALVLCSCGGSSDQAQTVTVVGDSLAVLGGGPIGAAVQAQGWQVGIDAFPGRTVQTQHDDLVAAAKEHRRATVIELGTNDAHALTARETDAATEQAQIAAALDLFPTDRCLVWVNADANPSRPGGTGGAVVNAAVAAQAASRPNLHVADLNALLAAHPEYFVDDEVHLTPVGYGALGQLIAAALDACR